MYFPVYETLVKTFKPHYYWQVLFDVFELFNNIKISIKHWIRNKQTKNLQSQLIVKLFPVSINEVKSGGDLLEISVTAIFDHWMKSALNLQCLYVKMIG